MFAKIAVWLGKAALVVLAGVGVLAVVIVWQLAGWLKSWGEPVKKKEPVPVVQMQEVKKEPVAVPVLPVASEAAAAGDCACPGAVCVGPNGGRYCLTDDGKKRYLKNQP